MSDNQKSPTKYKNIDNIKAYVQQIIEDGARTITAEKTAQISARPGKPGQEQIVSWSVDADGNPVREKETIVSADKTGTPDWVATKIDEQGKVIVDSNGHMNQWVISAAVFERKYEAVPEHPGIYKPVGGPQKFVCLKEGVHIVQWGQEWNVDADGYINITNPEDMYVVSGRDFRDTYRPMP